MLENMMFILLLCAIGLSELSPDKELSYSMIEVNHRMSPTGTHMFTQAICWDWHKLDKRFHVQAWSMLRFSPPKDELWTLKRYHKKGEWKLRFHDNCGKVIVCKARLYRESFTRYDPEFKDRSDYPECNRRGFHGKEEVLWQ